MVRQFKLNSAEFNQDSAKHTNIGLGSSIVNLSEYDFDDIEKSLLSKGLNFIPTPMTGQMEAVREGFKQFSRKVKLSYFFTNKKTGSTIHRHEFEKKYREKSSWEPHPKLFPPELIQELDSLEMQLGKIRPTPDTPNIPPGEYRALYELSKMDDLVFKKADKGNAIVVMSRQHYIDEALSQLDNSRFYQKIDEPVFQDTYEKVNDIIWELGLKKFLTPAQVQYLKPKEDANPRTFYILPKIHKTMDKWPVKYTRPPGRPIVSDVSSDSYRYSELIDDILRPLANIHPSFIKDTNHFLDQLRNQTFSTDAMLVTFDVESLYTNIQPNKGIEALMKVYRRAGIFQYSFEEIKSLLEISLSNNDFKFNNEWYLQVSGTAMGKKYAPNYANIFMANWEYEIMEKAKCKPKFYARFLDDGFLIWENSEKDLNEFLELMNSHDDSIKITTNISRVSADFLDVTVFKGNRFYHHNILDSKVHFKDTDTHELLDRHSFHPKHTFRGIIKSQLIRFLRICNNMEDFHAATSQLFKALSEKRHYSKRWLRSIKSEFLTKYHEMGDFEDPCGASMKCNKKRCECCLWIDQSSYHGDNEEYPIYGRMDCQSKNVIYVIECKKCKLKYVGETQRSLKDRLNNHLSDLRLFKDTNVADHFNYECTFDYGEWDFKIYPIEHIPDQGNTNKNKKKLLERETYWINELNTLVPNGINSKTSVKKTINISMPYNSASQKAYRLISQCFDNLKSKYPKSFNAELVCAYRKNKNLKDYLVRAKLR